MEAEYFLQTNTLNKAKLGTWEVLLTLPVEDSPTTVILTGLR